MDNIQDKLQGLSLSTGGEPPKLDNLPNEIKMMILKRLPDFSTLKFLIASSPGYHGVWKSNRHEILCAISGLTSIQPEVLIDAVAIEDASVPIEFPRRSRKAWMREVFNRIQNYHATRHDLVPEYRYNKDMNTLHTTIGNLTQHFISTAPHPTTGEPLGNLGELSKSEERRLQRAFYRFELFHRLFPRYRRDRDEYEQAWCAQFANINLIFIEKFEAWEVEEIACIQNYAWKVYAEALEKFNTELQAESFYFGQSDGIWPVVNVETLIGCGLQFLCDFIESPAPVQLELLKDNLPHPGEDELAYRSMLQALNQDCIHPRMHTKKYKERGGDDGSVLPFVSDDDTTGPNAGWVWINRGLYQWEYNQVENHGKRSWGHVFWDQERLENWGVFQMDPFAEWREDKGQAVRQFYEAIQEGSRYGPQDQEEEDADRESLREYVRSRMENPRPEDPWGLNRDYSREWLINRMYEEANAPEDGKEVWESLELVVRLFCSI